MVIALMLGMAKKSKRRSERLPIQLQVRWLRQPETVDMVSGDVNLHGMFLRTPAKALPGSLLHLEVTLPDGMVRMFVIARFVGATESGRGIGVEIFVMDERDQELWARHYRNALGRKVAMRTSITTAQAATR